MAKKLLALLLAVLMIFSLLPVSAFAGDGEDIQIGGGSGDGEDIPIGGGGSGDGEDIPIGGGGGNGDGEDIPIGGGETGGDGEDIQISDDPTKPSGTCGANVKWELDGTILKIVGTGVMGSYASSNDVPWSQYASTVQTVLVGSGVTSIGDHAFNGMSALASVSLPASVLKIGAYAFNGCSALTGIQLPANLTTLGSYAFNNCYSLASVTVPGTLGVIGEGAFAECRALVSLELPSGLRKLNSCVFYNCASLKSVNIPASVNELGDRVFYGCSSLTGITVPNKVTAISRECFYNCTSLRSVILGNSVKTFGECAFFGCAALNTVMLPASVESFDYAVFGGCDELDTVYYYGTQATWQTITVADGNDVLKSAEIVYLQQSTAVSVDALRFPDANFRSYILEHCDTDGDSKLSAAECSAVTELRLSSDGITDLTGIEYFHNLQILVCDGNALTGMDLTHNPALLELNCSSNHLTSLNVSSSKALRSLSCGGNALTSLDLSHNRALTALLCNNNRLETLDISYCPDLLTLICSDNRMATLNLGSRENLLSFLADGQTVTLPVGKVNAGNTVKLSDIVGLSNVSKVESVSGGELNSLFNTVALSSDSFSYVYNTGSGYTMSVTVSITDIPVNNLFFPDATFRSYVSENFDKNKDGMLSAAEREAAKSINLGIYSGVTSLSGVEFFPALEVLSCSYGELTQLDVSRNTALKYLYCKGNGITSLDLSHNPALIELTCSDNALTVLNVSGCAALTQLECSSNQLTALNVSDSTALVTLRCDFNRLASLDVSKNTALVTLDCSHMSISALDVSHNTALEALYCNDNALTALNVGSNTALKVLRCGGNPVTALSVSSNTALETLDCSQMLLSTLDVSHNTALKQLYCNNNTLSALDVSKNTALKILVCENNALAALDTSENSVLEDLVCSNNEIASLDLKNNPALTQLSCDGNLLTALDVSKNTALEDLYCSDNAISTLELSENTALAHVEIYGQSVKLTDDMADNGTVRLADIVGEDNVEKIISVTDGLYDSDNDTVTCTGVSFTYTYDAGQSYVLGATVYMPVLPIDEAAFPDAAFRTYIAAYFDSDKDGALNVAECEAVTGVYVSWSDIRDLRGLEYFPALTELQCAGLALTSLDLSCNPALVTLYCPGNKLSSLDLSYNPALQELNCGTNSLTALDLSHNAALEDLSCDKNALTALNVSYNPKLETLVCSNNALTALDVSSCALLQELQCDHNGINSLNTSSNAALKSLDCAANALTQLDVSHNAALAYLQCDSNRLSSLDVSSNTELTSLYCNSNALSALNVSSNTKLDTLDCGNNALSALDLSSNPYLASLVCENNALTALNVYGNSLLTKLVCGGNKLSALELGNNPLLNVQWTSLSSQSIETRLDKNGSVKAVDMAKLVGAENLWRIVSVANGTYNSTTGEVTIKGNSFSYLYDVANQGQTVLVNVNVPTPSKTTALSLYSGGEDVTGSTLTVDLNADANTLDLSAVYSPEDAVPTLTWKSSSPSVGSVDANGHVTILKTGKFNVTASTGDGSKKNAKVSISAVKLAHSVQILNAPATIQSGKSFTLKTDVQADKTLTDKNVVWSVRPQDEAFCTVKNGNLSAKTVFEPVTVEVTVSVKADPNASQTVSVLIQPTATSSLIYGPDGQLTSKTTLIHVDVGGSVTLSGAALPEGAFGTAAWKSSSVKIATVDNGTVFGLAKGTATITYSFGGKNATVKVIVGNPVVQIDFTAVPEGNELRSGKNFTFKAIPNADAGVQKLTYSLKNAADVAYCSFANNGKINVKTIYEEHPVTVVAAATDGTGFTAEYTITLKPKSDDLLVIRQDTKVLNGTTVALEPGDTLDLSVSNVLGGWETVTWKSSSAKTATVDENGHVEVLAKGSVTFTATSTMDKRNAKFTVKSAVKVHTITIGVKNDAAPIVISGKSLSLKSTINTDASNKKLSWSLVNATDAQYCTLNASNGSVRALSVTAPVTVLVQAASADGGAVSEPFAVDIYPAALAVNVYYAGRAVNNLTVTTEEKNFTLTSRVLPSGAQSGVTWKSSSAKVATVDENGNVSVLNPGKVSFTVTANDGSKKNVKVNFVIK